MDEIIPKLEAYNLFATFDDQASAAAAIQALRDSGVSHLSLTAKDANRYVAEAEMRDELESFGTRVKSGGGSDQKFGVGPEKEPHPSDRQMVVGVHTAEVPELHSAEATLLGLGAPRIDRVDPGGVVLSTEQTGLDSVPVEPGSGRQMDAV